MFNAQLLISAPTALAILAAWRPPSRSRWWQRLPSPGAARPRVAAPHVTCRTSRRQITTTPASSYCSDAQA